MNFTREPVVESVVTPKEGYKLLLRNSTGSGQEEFFVEAVEIVSFGQNCFFRSLEKPKNFLIPIADYEILEVREARMVFKTTAVEGGIKIAGGKGGGDVKAAASEQKTEKRRERRRVRKKKGDEEIVVTEPEVATAEPASADVSRSSLIPPPPTLIFETMAHKKEEEEVVKEVLQEAEKLDQVSVEEVGEPD